MANYVNFNETTIRYTDDENIVRYIPKSLGNVDYEIFLTHETTDEDIKAQTKFDAEQIVLEQELQNNLLAKQNVLEKLGLTADEAATLLG
jgi:hypothetical protein